MNRKSLFGRLLMLLAVCLAVLTLLSSSLLTAFAADGNLLELSLSSAQAGAGEEVTIGLFAVKNPGVCSMRFTFIYDSDKLTPVKTSDEGSVLSSLSGSLVTLPSVNSQNKTFVFVRANSTDVTGLLISITFRVSGDAAIGEQFPVAVRTVADGDVLDNDLKNVGYAVRMGYITVGQATASSDQSATSSVQSDDVSSVPPVASANESELTNPEVSSWNAYLDDITASSQTSSASLSNSSQAAKKASGPVVLVVILLIAAVAAAATVIIISVKRSKKNTDGQ